jgi:hypothetical protein
LEVRPNLAPVNAIDRQLSLALITHAKLDVRRAKANGSS